jgi:hypothetical protein
MTTKGEALKHLKTLLNARATIFGVTLLHEGLSLNRFARRLMHFYNAKGIFSNSIDNLEGLKRMLNQHLHEPSVKVVGCAALFSGTV